MENKKSSQAIRQMKKVKKLLLGRVIFIALAVALQFSWIFLVAFRFSRQYSFLNIILEIIGILMVLHIINQWSNPAYKIVWTFVILIFPLGGILIYVMFGRSKLTKHTRERMEHVHQELVPLLPKNEDLERAMAGENPVAANQSSYMTNWADYPVYDNTKTKYYTCGEEMYPDMLRDLAGAEHFIFLEYFILDDGVMLETIVDILEEKAKSGVDVRLIYDDFGTITTLSPKFFEQLRRKGIKCVPFNRLRPVMSVIMNNRDHRKIFVVDGVIGYTGGLNLADEYINVRKRFGYWKDTGIRLYGDAVWSFTAMFLEMWNYINRSSEDYMRFHPQNFPYERSETPGYVQPYGDTPLDKEKVGENVYMNLIGHASKYVYIFTPYLILDNEMLTYLRNAAKSGVDVRIVTPEIPDKKIIFWMTQSYYQRLLECGVRIYQYTPGFIHAKTFVCDDEFATVGSINMDFRSLYLHFECGVWLYGTDTIAKIKQDADDTIACSREITIEDCARHSWLKRGILSVLRLIAPLV